MPHELSLSTLLSNFFATAIRAYDAVTHAYPTATRVYLGILLTAGLVYLSTQPVGTSDTDLWYHLNGGRLLWEFGQLPDSGFYSFLGKDRSWTNYFWGFQSLSYLIHEAAGYPGLIALRTLLSGITLLTLTAMIVRKSDRLHQRAWSLVLLAVVAMVLFGRIAWIRPHLFSYMMIAVFLLILSRKRSWLPALPFLTALWVNVHGVEWPVGAAICGAYFIQEIWNWRFRRESPDLRLMAWTLACLPALLLNPFGPAILSAPFNTPNDIYAYIAELRPLLVDEVVSGALWGPLLPTFYGALVLLGVGTLLSAGVIAYRQAIRPAPLLLAVVGFLLLARGFRFIWEWLLLTIPFWRLAIDLLASETDSDKRRPLAALATAYALTFPFTLWVATAKPIATWPLDSHSLPVGVAAFVRQQGIEGLMLSPPTPSGYLEWMLYPKILTSGDMQIPPTLPWDHYRVTAAFGSERGLARMVADHAPKLIAAQRHDKRFRRIITDFPQFRPVFFDDHLVLYADRDQLPDLVARFEIKHVNPFNLADKKDSPVEDRLTELKRILSVDRNAKRAQHGIVWALFDAQQYEAALPFARSFAATHPRDPNAPYMLGNILATLDRCEEARPHFLAALTRADEAFRAIVQTHLGSCAYLTQDFDAAYEHFTQGINNYRRLEEPGYLYQYAFAAAAVGETDKARTLLRQLLYTIPPDEERIQARATALLDDLSGRPN